MPSPTEITVPQLAKLVGTPDCPHLIDLRIEEDFTADPDLNPGAIRHPFTDVKSLLEKAATLSGTSARNSSFILYCQKGLKISQGVGAQLRSDGVRAEEVQGGHFAWRDAGLPLVPASAIPVKDALERSVWVTRQRPKIDRIACPWLIRRFVDPNAQFLFVTPGQVQNVAEKFNATAFDMDEGFWSHRGENCTFDTMIEEFKLSFPALEKLAAIIRAADTDHCSDAPEAAGLLAASLGFSRMYRDDHRQLDATIPLYDALYRWARDASDERHIWPPNPSKALSKKSGDGSNLARE